MLDFLFPGKVKDDSLAYEQVLDKTPQLHCLKSMSLSELAQHPYILPD